MTFQSRDTKNQPIDYFLELDRSLFGKLDHQNGHGIGLFFRLLPSNNYKLFALGQLNELLDGLLFRFGLRLTGFSRL